MNLFIDFEAHGRTGEIISIGCTTENKNHTFSRLVHVNTPLDNYTKQITSITQGQINRAKTLDEVVEDFEVWLQIVTGLDQPKWNDLTFYCYGDQDQRFVEISMRKCENYKTYMFLAALNTRIVDYELYMRGSLHRINSIGLLNAVNLFHQDAPLEQHHSAVDDAELLRDLFQHTHEQALKYAPIDYIGRNQIICRKPNGKIITFENFKAAALACEYKVNKGEKAKSKNKSKNVKKKLKNAILKNQPYFDCHWYVDLDGVNSYEQRI